MGIEKLNFESAPSEKNNEKHKKPKNVTRRDFLKMAGGAVGMGGLAAIGYPKAKQFITEILTEDTLKKEVEKKINFFKESYGFDLDLGEITPDEEKNNIKGQELSLAEKHDFLLWLEREIIKYPPEFIKDWCKINKIRGLNDFSTSEGDLGGLANHHGEIYICANRGVIDFEGSFGWESSKNFTRTFHHELFHIANFNYETRGKNLNPVWNEYTTKPEIYSRKWDYQITWNPLRKKFYEQIFMKRPDGFAEKYGIKEEEEDQATIAELLLSNPKKAFALAREDKVIAKKIDIITECYLVWSKGRMDDFYWQHLYNKKVNAKYWSLKGNI